MKWEGLIEEITELWKKQMILGMGEEDGGKCISTSEARFKGVNLAPKGEVLLPKASANFIFFATFF